MTSLYFILGRLIQGSMQLVGPHRERSQESPDDWTESERGFFARHKDIKELSQPVYLQEIRKAFPKWKRWNNLRGVRVHIVPLNYRQRLTRLITAKNETARPLLKAWLSRDNASLRDASLTAGSPVISEEELSAFEGVRTESVSYKRGRSRRLRDSALAISKGICAVCAVEYSALFESKGVRVLQVHHRKQLAIIDRPRVTKQSDLAVVCANCHMLIHMDLKRALSVEKLRTMLRGTRA